MPTHLALAEQWREDARALRRCGAMPQAEREEERARELEEVLGAWQGEALTLRQAEAESGLSYSTLQQYLSQGVLPNAGKPGRPRIRRCDLPRRGTRLSGGPDLASTVLRHRL